MSVVCAFQTVLDGAERKVLLCSHVFGIVAESLIIEFFWWFTNSDHLNGPTDSLHIKVLQNSFCFSDHLFYDTAHVWKESKRCNKPSGYACNKPTQDVDDKAAVTVERGSVKGSVEAPATGVSREAQACAVQHRE